MKKVKLILFLSFFILTNQYAQNTDSITRDFLLHLKAQEDKIIKISSDITYTIKGIGKKNVVQKGVFLTDKEKGTIKIEFTEPIYQLVLVKDGETFIKNSPSAELKKVNNAAQFNFMMDLFQYNFFSQYKYKVENHEIKNDKYKLAGYKGDKKELELIYDNKEGIITDYYILGNPISPFVAISFDYKDIKTGDNKTIKIPVKLLTRVKAKSVTVKSTIEFSNMKINE